MVLTTNGLACIWIFLGRLDKDSPYLTNPNYNKKLSWVYNWDNAFDPDKFLSIYICAVYWILETITTVGYGEYYARVRYEYIFSMFLEVISYLLTVHYLTIVCWANIFFFYDG